ncbi:MAG: hypothetical protein P8L85_19245 [Rubripirellula sp.]|nr:hypothetical protein [Rubripirellula sp.]
MIVAMITVRMMQMSIYKVINMIAMGNRLVTAAGSMLVTRVVASTGVRRSAGVRVCIGHFELMFDDAPVIGYVVQVTVVQIVYMVTMLDTGVFTIGTMLVVMILVYVSHYAFSWFKQYL